MIMLKFNMAGSENIKQSCFTQQIRMQPPDILKSATSTHNTFFNQSQSGVFTPGSNNHMHYAPAIPLKSRPGTVMNIRETTQDLIMKAKAGIQQGDFLKETHINF